MKTKSLLLFVASFTLTAVLGLASQYLTPLPSALLLALRWISIATLVLYALFKRTLTTWILVAMITGAVLGHDWPHAALSLRLLSMIFLRLIRCIIAPLLFGTLVSGIAAHSDLKKVGRTGLKAIVYFEAVTTFALFIGLAAINLSKAGVGVHLPPAGGEVVQVQRMSASETILHIFPENLAKSVAEGQILQVVVFSILFGIALAMVREERRRPLVNLAESLTETMFKFTNLVMYLAPLGVGAAIAVTVGSKGVGVLFGLGKLIGTMYVTAVLYVLLVLVPVVILFRIPARRFYRAVRQPFLIAFSTASSEAALPLALENMEEFGVPKHIVGFVLPTGYSFNLDGSTLYLSIAAIFVAQGAGIHLSLGQQLVIMLTLMLTSKGVAGVPRAAIVILTGTLATFHLPMEGIAVLLGVDAVLDMARTSINVLGNCLASAVVARWEGYGLEAR